MPFGWTLDGAAAALALATAQSHGPAMPEGISAEEIWRQPPLRVTEETNRDCCALAFRPRGLIQYDVSDRHASGTAQTLENGQRTGDLRSNLRRGQLGFEGEAGQSLRFSLAYDFGGAAGERKGRLNSAWVGWRVAEPVEMRMGIFAPPGGLEGPAAGLLFLERAAPVAVVRSTVGNSSRPAIGLFGQGRNWTASFVVNGDSIYAEAERGQRTAFARLTTLAVENDAARLHLGVVVMSVLRTRVLDGDEGVGTLRLGERGELRIDAARLVDTGPMRAGSALATMFEVGAQWRRWLVQGEYMGFRVDRADPGSSDASHEGWYVQIGRVFGSNGRRYARSNGSFAAPESSRRRGSVWELGMRYSYLSLDHALGPVDSPLSPGEVRGGRQQVFSIGVNWYASAALRFQAMVQHVAVDRLSPRGELSSDRSGVASLRAQYAF